MKKSILIQIALFALSVNCLLSQNWAETWSHEKNFYTIQNEFNEYWKDKDASIRGKGYKQFKRWEDFVAPRVYPSGDLTLIGQTWKNYEEYLSKQNSNYKVNGTNQTTSSVWTAMGPMGNLTGNATNGLPRKAGRLNFITFHPTILNTFWVGGADGGLWKTTDGGITWTTNTDNLSVIGCSDLAINPLNPLEMYLATGDGNPIRCKSSIGVLKSTDGGLTWAPTQLVFSLTSPVFVRHIAINPTNPQIVLASTSIGIFRTINGGTTWPPATPVQAGDIFDLEYKPGSSDTVYSGGKSFRRSLNKGASWTQITTGIPTSGAYRMEVATSPANPNIVYVISATNTTYGLQGVYKSTDCGTTFSTMITTPNIVGQDCFTTTGTGGQGWYDLGIDASPFNANEVSVGGIGMWKSLDGGATWAGFGCAYNWSSPDPFLHADHQEVEYNSAGTLYSVNDGGIDKYNGSIWIDLTNPMNIAQIYKFGMSSLSPNKWISGHQDNGSNIYSNGVYSASLAGDGMYCFIDRTNDQNMFASLPFGNFQSTTNGGANWNAVSGVPGNGGWVSPWKQDPVVANNLYAGKTQLYKSTSLGAFWVPTTGVMAGITAGEYIVEFAIAPTNTQYIYVIHGTSGIQVTTDGGNTWTQRTVANGLPNLSATNIAVDPTNHLIAWVSYSGFTAGQKVYKTINGGALWTQVSSTGLPNLPANCLLFEPGSTSGRVYLGMDLGVYYMDNTTANAWVLYNTGLPNTIVKDLQISPASPTKLRAATFGRGVYEVDVPPNAVAPVTSFAHAAAACTLPSSVSYTDASSNSPTSWNWTVNPATGVTITSASSQNPNITFANAGTYTVSLVASNAFGVGNTSSQSILVGPPLVNATTSSAAMCVGQTVSLTGSGAATYTWQPGNLGGAVVNVSPAATQIYTLTATGANACAATDTVSVLVSTCVGIQQATSNQLNFTVFPNPTYDRLNIKIVVNKETEFVSEMIDVSGKVVLKQTLNYNSDKSEQKINIAFLESGIYFLKIISKENSSQTIKIIKQ